MKMGRLKKLYIYLHFKYCKLFNKKMIKEYTAVYKYKNKKDIQVIVIENEVNSYE